MAGNFCPACGQRASVRRIDFRSLLKDVPPAVFQVDRGFAFNVVQLFKRPGYAIRDYLEGKRKPFFNPLSYMLVVLATMLIAMNLLRVHYYDPVQDAWMRPDQAAAWQAYDASQQAWIHLYKYYIPFYLPWMALIFYGWLRLMRERYSYWESVVISLFVSAQMTIPQVVILVFAYAVNRTAFTRISDVVVNSGVIATLYFFQFYQLASPGLPPRRRIVLAAAGAILLLAFAYLAVFTFLEFSQWAGLSGGT